jgi:hypothetical protein
VGKRDYYKQARFAGNRFQAKGNAVQSHEAAYLASKQVETFATSKRRIGEPHPTLEVLYQCWDCGKVGMRQAEYPGRLVCLDCRGKVEILTIDGEAVS